MAADVSIEVVRQALVTMLDEVMETARNCTLDDGTSAFETLAGITAEEASRPVSSHGLSPISQVDRT